MTNDLLERIAIWDIVVRVFHWVLVGSFFLAWFADGSWMPAHIVAGYVIFLLLVVRVV